MRASLPLGLGRQRSSLRSVEPTLPRAVCNRLVAWIVHVQYYNRRRSCERRSARRGRPPDRGRQAMRFRSIRCATIAALLVAVLVADAPRQARAGVTSEEVEASIKRAMRFLKEAQKEDGSWLDAD